MQVSVTGFSFEHLHKICVDSLLSCQAQIVWPVRVPPVRQPQLHPEAGPDLVKKTEFGCRTSSALHLHAFLLCT